MEKPNRTITSTNDLPNQIAPEKIALKADQVIEDFDRPNQSYINRERSFLQNCFRDQDLRKAEDTIRIKNLETWAEERRIYWKTIIKGQIEITRDYCENLIRSGATTNSKAFSSLVIKQIASLEDEIEIAIDEMMDRAERQFERCESFAEKGEKFRTLSDKVYESIERNHVSAIDWLEGILKEYRQKCNTQLLIDETQKPSALFND